MSTMECPYLPYMTTRAGLEDYTAPGTHGMNIVKWSLQVVGQVSGVSNNKFSLLSIKRYLLIRWSTYKME